MKRAAPQHRPVVMRCDTVLLADFDAVAAAAGLTRSAALRQLMQRAIDEFHGVPSLFTVTDDKGQIFNLPGVVGSVPSK